MVQLSRAHEEHVRELLESTLLSVDALPYSGEFVRLKEEFWDRSFKKLTDAEFWQILVNVRKKGGAATKGRGEPAPELTPDQIEAMLRVLPVPIGQRDRLPYTPAFTSMVRKFNLASGLDLTEREVWLAILRQAK